MSEPPQQTLAKLGADLVLGPLKGRHHEAYASRLTPDSPLYRQDILWVKYREPRLEPLRFDRRPFESEEALLDELKKLRIPRIPEILRCPAITVHQFIEGSTLRPHRRESDGKVQPAHLEQILTLVERLAGITPDELSALKSLQPGWAPDGSSTDYFHRLIAHTQEQLAAAHEQGFGELYSSLGIGEHALKDFQERTGELTERPYSLLHGDLHSENFIIDGQSNLWTIDWELADIGDPLYELATHLHLMHYPKEQEDYLTGQWTQRVKAVLEGSTEGIDKDLEHYRAYKCAQSVYTDVVRQAVATSSAAEAGRTIHRAMVEAQAPLGLTDVPSPDAIARIYRRWRRRQ